MSQASNHNPAPNLLLVTPQPGLQAAIGAVFQKHGWGQLHVATGTEEALAFLAGHPVERLWVDATVAMADRLVTAARPLMSRSAQRPPSVVVLAGADALDHLAWVALGVDEWVDHPFEPAAFEARCVAWWRERADWLERCDRLALADAQTGLPNQVAGRAALQKAEAAALRSGYPLSVLMWAVPYPAVTDTARHVLQGARTEDLLVRWAPDRLLLVAHRANLLDAARFAERLCKAMPPGGGHAVGVASVGAAPTGGLGVLDLANRALEEALGVGGGAVAMWTGSGPRFLAPVRRG